MLYNINTDVGKAIYDIADIYLGEKLDSKIEEDQDKTPQNVKVSEEMLDQYIGTYKVFSAWYITISRDGDQLMALETNKEIYPIPAISETEFRVGTWNTTMLERVPKFTGDPFTSAIILDESIQAIPKRLPSAPFFLPSGTAISI